MEGLLKEVDDALGSIDDTVFYGMADIGKDEQWNYVVYFREQTPYSDNLTGTSHGIGVCVVREGFVPEDMAGKVATAMGNVKGMCLAKGQGIEFDYMHHPSTGRVVEAMLMHFMRPAKGRP